MNGLVLPEQKIEGGKRIAGIEKGDVRFPVFEKIKESKSHVLAETEDAAPLTHSLTHSLFVVSFTSLSPPPKSIRK